MVLSAPPVSNVLDDGSVGSGTDGDRLLDQSVEPSRVSPTTETTEKGILFDRDTTLSLKTRLPLAEIETQDEEAEMPLSAASLGGSVQPPQLQGKVQPVLLQ